MSSPSGPVISRSPTMMRPPRLLMALRAVSFAVSGRRDEVQFQFNGDGVFAGFQDGAAGAGEGVVGEGDEYAALDDAGALAVAVGDGHQGSADAGGRWARADAEEGGKGAVLFRRGVQVAHCILSSCSVLLGACRLQITVSPDRRSAGAGPDARAIIPESPARRAYAAAP